MRRSAITKDAVRFLKGCEWPGNVRELENVIEHVLLLFKGDQIRREHLNIRSRKNTKIENKRVISINRGFKEMIENALEESNGNISLTLSF